MLDEGCAGAANEARPGQALYRAYVDADRADERYGNLAGLILYWITGGRGDPASLDTADQILNGSSDDPRRAKVNDIVHRLAAGEITWDEFAKTTKKGLIAKPPPHVPEPPPDSIPLATAKEALEGLLNLDGGVPSLAAWQGFVDFAHRSVAATAPLHVENDMCLVQWGVYDWGEGRHFECDFTRQFVLHDGDGDYDHMEQLSLTLLFNAEDLDLVALGSGELWSGDDLDSWFREVEGLDLLRVVSSKATLGFRLDHTEV
jgi:hypothetical protein